MRRWRGLPESPLSEFVFLRFKEHEIRGLAGHVSLLYSDVGLEYGIREIIPLVVLPNRTSQAVEVLTVLFPDLRVLEVS